MIFEKRWPCEIDLKFAIWAPQFWTVSPPFWPYHVTLSHNHAIAWRHSQVLTAVAAMNAFGRTLELNPNITLNPRRIAHIFTFITKLIHNPSNYHKKYGCYIWNYSLNERFIIPVSTFPANSRYDIQLTSSVMSVI